MCHLEAGREVESLFVTVVTDGWAVADTASCEEAGVSVPLGGLWLCELETELPVAAP